MPENQSQFTPGDKQKLDDIHHALMGDPFDRDAKPGFLAMVIKHDETLYGDGDRIGLERKVEINGENVQAIDSRWKKFAWTIGGAVTAFTIVAAILNWLFTLARK